MANKRYQKSRDFPVVTHKAPLWQGDCIHPNLTGYGCVGPESSNFEDGSAAEGCWVADGLHYEQVVGSSGIYLVVTDLETRKVVRDDRPWQMTS